MTLCTKHNIFFHGEIEDCYICERVKNECKHEVTKVDWLGSRRFVGLTGEWEVCVNCNSLVQVKSTT